MMSVESRLAAIRQSRGIAAADLAGRVGVSRQTIYAIEAGEYVPNTAVALKLARELEVRVEDLFALGGEAQAPPRGIKAQLLAAETEAGAAVRVAQVKGGWVGVPATGVPYYLAEGDGVVSRANAGAGQTEVQLAAADDSFPRRLVVAGCDPAIGLAARMAERLAGLEVLAAPAASRKALEWLKAGRVHIAGSHLQDPVSKEFNVPFVRNLGPRADCLVVTFARWEEGFVVARGNPLRIRGVEDLTGRKVRLMNREAGSGSRILLESLLRDAGIAAERVRGFETAALGHLAAAYAVQTGAADCCVATPSAARAFGLDFVPVRAERFDFAVRRDCADLPAVKAFLDILQRADLRRKLESQAGYDTSETGRLVSG